MMFAITRVLPVLIAAIMAASTAHAATCTSRDFAAAVDQSAAELRKLNSEFQPRLQEKMLRFKEAAGLPSATPEDAALDAIQDQRISELDSKSGDLILKIDQLGRVVDGETPDCAKLTEISASSSELIAVIRAKSEYMLARLDAKIAEAAAKKTASAKDEAPAPPAKPKPAPKAPAPAPKPPAAPPQSTAANEPPANWTPKTKAEPDAAPGPSAFITPEQDGYTIDEIRNATTGFFGPISTNLASVLEYAFKTSGRPSAYVLGTEGGGAFLAGLRYGSGTLFMRNMPGQTKVYWHGPSIGYDAGVEGGRTLFLIYHLAGPQDLYRTYTGINGSAFLVGGIGITYLQGGDVVMAPVRSGLGVRLGANLGYVRFTGKPTWNPF